MAITREGTDYIIIDTLLKTWKKRYLRDIDNKNNNNSETKLDSDQDLNSNPNSYSLPTRNIERWIGLINKRGLCLESPQWQQILNFLETIRDSSNSTQEYQPPTQLQSSKPIAKRLNKISRGSNKRSMTILKLNYF